MSIQLELYEYEIAELVQWHVDQEYQAANKGRYSEAEEHQQRAKWLREQLALKKEPK